MGVRGERGVRCRRQPGASRRRWRSLKPAFLPAAAPQLRHRQGPRLPPTSITSLHPLLLNSCSESPAMASIEELSLSDHEDAPQLVASDADLDKVIVRPSFALLTYSLDPRGRTTL